MGKMFSNKNLTAEAIYFDPYKPTCVIPTRVLRS